VEAGEAVWVEAIVARVAEIIAPRYPDASAETGTHNSGPLGRRHHKWKTHAGYRFRQSGAGRYVWLTPHGLGYLVDHRGTRRIPAERARMILDAPPDIDLYPGVPIDLPKRDLGLA